MVPLLWSVVMFVLSVLSENALHTSKYRNLPFFRLQNFCLINFRVTLFSDAPRCPKIFPVQKILK